MAHLLISALFKAEILIVSYLDPKLSTAFLKSEEVRSRDYFLKGF
jgi:hypothetical protein